MRTRNVIYITVPRILNKCYNNNNNIIAVLNIAEKECQALKSLSECVHSTPGKRMLEQSGWLKWKAKPRRLLILKLAKTANSPLTTLTGPSPGTSFTFDFPFTLRESIFYHFQTDLKKSQMVSTLRIRQILLTLTSAKSLTIWYNFFSSPFLLLIQTCQ